MKSPPCPAFFSLFWVKHCLLLGKFFAKVKPLSRAHGEDEIPTRKKTLILVFIFSIYPFYGMLLGVCYSSSNGKSCKSLKFVGDVVVVAAVLFHAFSYTWPKYKFVLSLVFVLSEMGKTKKKMEHINPTKKPKEDEKKLNSKFKCTHTYKHTERK